MTRQFGAAFLLTFSLLIATLLRLTTVFGEDASGNSFLRALLHINTQAINFVDEANGWKRLKLDVAAVTFGQDGRVVDEFTRTHTIRIPPEALALVRQNGLVYSADTPVKSPGAYQFRIVVRDADSNKFGSATQFIEIPDLKKGLLGLSSIALAHMDPNSPRGLPPVVPAEAALSLVQSPSSPAVRRFRPGMVLSYALATGDYALQIIVKDQQQAQNHASQHNGLILK